MSDDPPHYLDDFLQHRLDELGLDPDTYGAYVKGLVDDDADDDNGNEWDDILELLQASSETHSDDTTAWTNLKEEILKRQTEHVKKEQEVEETKKQERLQEEQEKLQQEILLAQQQELQLAEEAEQEPIMDDAKRALVAKYAYDDSERYDKDGNLKEKTGSQERYFSNKDVARQANTDKSKEQRSQQRSTKKDEQEKTAKARQDKVRLKEERRNRAQKGERKR